MDGKKLSGFWLLYMAAAFFSLDYIVPVLYLSFVRMPVPAPLAWLSLAVRAVFSVLFIVFYIRRKKGLSVKGGFKVFLPSLINGALLVFAAEYLYSLLSVKIGTGVFAKGAANLSAGGFTFVTIISLLVLYTTLFFALVWLKASGESETGIMQSTDVYISVLKAFFKKIYLSLPFSILLGAVLTAYALVFEKLIDFATYHLNPGIFSSLGIFLLEALVCAFIFLLFLSLADKVFKTEEEKEYKSTIPFASIGLLALCVICFIVCGGVSRETSIDAVIADANERIYYADIYQSGSDYRNAYYEDRLALSENLAMQGYVQALIVNKNGQSNYSDADALFKKASDICRDNGFVYLFKARRFCFLEPNYGYAVQTLMTIEGLNQRDAHSDTLLLRALHNLNDQNYAAQRSSLVTRMIINGYYYDSYDDIEKISLKRLYNYQEKLEAQEKDIYESYYENKAYLEMSYGRFTDANRTLNEWVEYSDSLEANYTYSKFASQYAYEGTEYEKAAERALAFGSRYVPANESEKVQLEYYVASVLVECNEFQKCADYLKDKYQDDSRLTIRYAYALYNLTQYDESASILEKMIAQNSEDWQAIYLMARIKLAQNEPAEAFGYIERLEAPLKTTDNDELRNFLDESIYMFAMNCPQDIYKYFVYQADAVGEAAETYGYNPDGITAGYMRIYYNWYYNYPSSAGDLKEEADRLLAIRDDLYTPHYYKAIRLYEDGEYEEAVEEFNRAWAIDEKAEIPFQLGYVYDNLEMYGTAIRMWNRVRAELPVINHNGADSEGYAMHALDEIIALREHLGEVR